MHRSRRETEARRAFLRYRSDRDPSSIARVFDLTRPVLASLARQLLVDPAQVEDLVQTTFLDAIERMRSYDRERRLIPWLCGILVNHVRAERRRAARRLDRRCAPERVDAMTPDRVAQAREIEAEVAAALSRLPSTYREVLRLRLVGGLATGEISRALRRPVETVRSQLTRGMARLRRELPRGAAPALGVGAAGALAGRATACAARIPPASAATRPLRWWAGVAVAAAGAMVAIGLQPVAPERSTAVPRAAAAASAAAVPDASADVVRVPSPEEHPRVGRDDVAELELREVELELDSRGGSAKPRSDTRVVKLRAPGAAASDRASLAPPGRRLQSEEQYQVEIAVVGTTDSGSPPVRRGGRR